MYNTGEDILKRAAGELCQIRKAQISKQETSNSLDSLLSICHEEKIKPERQSRTRW